MDRIQLTLLILISNSSPQIHPSSFSSFLRHLLRSILWQPIQTLLPLSSHTAQIRTAILSNTTSSRSRPSQTSRRCIAGGDLGLALAGLDVDCAGVGGIPVGGNGGIFWEGEVGLDFRDAVGFALFGHFGLRG